MNTIKNQLKRSKKLILLLITLTTFTNMGYTQNGLSKGFSIEAGLGTSHAPSFLSLNYDIPLNDNFYWTLSAGAPSQVTGIRYVNEFNNHSHTLVFGRDFYKEMLIRYSWVKEKEIGYSGNWSLNYGVQIFLVKWYYGQTPSRPGEPVIEDYIWQSESFLSTKGDLLVLKYLPFPLVNLRYKF